MGDEHIAEFRGLAAHLAVKIQPPRCETSLLQHSLWKYIYMSLDQILYQIEYTVILYQIEYTVCRVYQTLQYLPS